MVLDQSYVCFFLFSFGFIATLVVSSDPSNFSLMEVSLRQMELKRFQDVTTKLKMNGYTIHGFYHTSAWREHWQGVVEEQLQLMDGVRHHFNASKPSRIRGKRGYVHQWASLLDASDSLHLSIAGDENVKMNDFKKVREAVLDLNLKNIDKVTMRAVETVPRGFDLKNAPTAKKEYIESKPVGEVTTGEVSTVNELHAFCKKKKDAGEKALVFYLHNKGGCCPKYSNTPVEHWRDLMNSFVIEFPSICLRALSLGYSACGPEYQDSHYSGNFWWADCDHVGALEPLGNMFDAYAAEFFIWDVPSGNAKYATHCGYNPFHCRVDHYHDMCPRSSYLPTIFDSVITPGLPPNPTASINNSIEYARNHCSLIRSEPFKNQDQKTRNGWWIE